MVRQDRKKTTYTKEMLIREIADELRISVNRVRDVYNALESDVARLLSTADSDADVSIRIFEGITIDSMFVPEKTKLNNLTGETIVTSEKIKPKAHITRNYCEKITSYGK